MADSYEKRRRRKGRYESGARGDEASQGHSQPQATKPPMKILGLAKPTRAPVEIASPAKGGDEGHDNNQLSTDTCAASSGDKSSVTVLASQSADPRHHASLSNKLSEGDTATNEYRRTSTATHSIPEGALSDNNSPQYHHLRKSTIPNSVMTGSVDSPVHPPQNKLAPPFEKQSKTKIIDDALQWLDSGFDLLLDQTDFLVVGIVGLQGCGKSTILSLLAGNSQQDAYRNYIFSPQSKETKEDCMFQTTGVDMYVTPERIIYLDCQPMLSPAIMDCLIRYERKLPSDFSSLQNLVEMQSLQLLTFLLSVCNTVLVVDDWFVDVNLLRFIQDAEMLKPSQPPTSQSSESSSSKEDNTEFFPNVVFVHNKATREDFSPDSYHMMQNVLQGVFSSSKLRIKTGTNMVSGNSREPLINIPPGKEGLGVHDINLILLPVFEFYKCDPECLETTLPDYRGYPSFNTIFSHFRSQILAGQRMPLTYSTLSEKNWYHFAARIWESVKKSPLLAEYNRLLSNS